jgi:hypothetical protein
VELGDNSAAWQKYARETLGLEANVCQTHATAIAANNGSHKKFFDDVNKNYKSFYQLVNRIMCCSFASVGEGLQELLVEWLRSVREERASEWLSSGGAEQPRGYGCWAMEVLQCLAINKDSNRSGGGIDRR